MHITRVDESLRYFIYLCISMASKRIYNCFGNLTCGAQTNCCCYCYCCCCCFCVTAYIKRLSQNEKHKYSDHCIIAWSWAILHCLSLIRPWTEVTGLSTFSRFSLVNETTHLFSQKSGKSLLCSCGLSITYNR